MITVTPDSFALTRTFTISRGSKTHANVLTVRVSRGGATGWGECVPYSRYDETLESVAEQIKALPADIAHKDLPDALPPGAARNALDCAMWDLAAKATGTPVWHLIGLPPPAPVQIAYTLSLEEPAAMRVQAAEHAHRPLLKIKLGTPDDLPRLEAVRQGAPTSRLIIDANEGWTAQDYLDLAPRLIGLGVELVEQPLPAGQDDILAQIPRPLPICADESCHDRASLAQLKGKYDVVNIKLDKTGGLTEALATRDEARRLGFGIMVGCMVGSSLAMAPAVLVAQGAAFCDLDGPLLLAKDRDIPMSFGPAEIYPAPKALWG